jgi:hypothetical protein
MALSKPAELIIGERYANELYNHARGFVDTVEVVIMLPYGVSWTLTKRTFCITQCKNGCSKIYMHKRYDSLWFLQKISL